MCYLWARCWRVRGARLRVAAKRGPSGHALGMGLVNQLFALSDPESDIEITIGGLDPDERSGDSDHTDNLVDRIAEVDLRSIAEDLLEGVAEDERSRREWLAERAAGIKLLGFKLEEPRSDLANASAPVEGMSTVRHPVLGEAVLRAQACACGELLPADGPVKVRAWGRQTLQGDVLAERLEDTLNYFLTIVATEYAPDTRRMLFMVMFSGMAFKKIYRCAIRRRPVSECVDAEHLVVNNSATDIQSAPRVTHVIQMSPAVFRRMQLAGVYRDIDLVIPTPEINLFDAARARHAGVDLNTTRPEDTVRTIYEIYTDLDIPGFEHTDRNGQPTGLPVPYRVTIDKTARQVLEVRRDWAEGDEDYIRKRTFVPFGYVPAFGFYDLGLLQIMSNPANALTAAWRLMLDAGMFSNFPGFLYAKNGARQVANNFRVPPGGGAPVEAPSGTRLADVIMPLPYKGPDPALMQLAESISQATQRLGGAAETPVSEGRADVPVGSMLAIVEQAAKVQSEVHVRLCESQALELGRLRELLLEDPEALWRGTPNRNGWSEDEVMAALEAYNLTPRADPNTPSHVHRLMKASALMQVAMAAPPAVGFDGQAVAKRVLSMLRIDDADALFLPPQSENGQPSAEDMIARAANDANMVKAQSQHEQNQVKLLDIQTRAQMAQAKIAADLQLERERAAQHAIVHNMLPPLGTT